MNHKRTIVEKLTSNVIPNMRYSFHILLIFSAFSLLTCQDSLRIGFTGINELNKIETSKPLYENHIENYRKSQAIRHGVRWGSMTAIPFTFFIMNTDVDDCEFICIPILISTIIAPPSFGVLGGIYGYWKGGKLNSIKSSNPNFHTNKYTFGHEFCFEKGFLSENTNYDIYDRLKYSLVIQNFNNKKYIPTEYRLGYTVKEWREKDKRDWESDENFFEKRANFDILFNSNKNIFNLHYGFGLGYSWTKHETNIDSDTTTSKAISGAFGYPIVGATVNVSDFFYLRLEGKYVISDILNQVTDFYGEPEYGNFSLGFTLGTYIF